jgi:uncharacterized membrane protein YqjE
MPTRDPEAPPRRPPSFLHSAKAYVGVWVEVLKVRLELFSTEWQEECLRLEQIFILAAATVLCLALGLLLVTLFIVAAFWETDYRLAVLGGFALFYLAGGIAAGLVMRRVSRNKPKLFSATIEELAKDYRHLSS